MIFNIMFYTEKMPRNRPPQFQIGQACGTGRRPLGATKVMFSGTLDKVCDGGPRSHTKLIMFIGKPIDLASFGKRPYLEFPAVAFQCSRQSNKHHICLGRLPRGSACAYLQSGILHRNCITWYAWMANGLRKVQGWCHEVMRNVVSSS